MCAGIRLGGPLSCRVPGSLKVPNIIRANFSNNSQHFCQELLDSLQIGGPWRVLDRIGPQSARIRAPIGPLGHPPARGPQSWRPTGQGGSTASTGPPSTGDQQARRGQLDRLTECKLNGTNAQQSAWRTPRKARATPGKMTRCQGKNISTDPKEHGGRKTMPPNATLPETTARPSGTHNQLRTSD